MENLRVYPPAALSFLRDLLPTITSPMFSDVVIVLQESTIHDTRFMQHILFDIARGMHEVKPFCLVFCLEVWEGNREYVTGELKRYTDADAAKGGLDFLPCPPAIISDTRVSRRPVWEGLRA